MEKVRGIVFLGNSGAGKGTLIESLSGYKQFYPFSTGAMYRYLETVDNDFGRQIRKLLEKGKYIDDSTTMKQIDYFVSCMVGGKSDVFSDAVLDGRLFQPERDIIIFDGIPRTIPQAESLDSRFDVIRAFYVNTTQDVCEERLIKRGRKDDLDPETRYSRFESFRINALPILERGYYNSRLSIIEGNVPKDEMINSFLNIIKYMPFWNNIHQNDV